MTRRYIGNHVLDVSAIEDALDEIAGMLSDRQQSSRVALAGGIAMQAYGSTRFTSDIDLVALEPIDGLDSVASLSIGGYSALLPSGVEVDVILRDDDFADLYADAVRQAKSLRQIPIRVVTPPFLAAMKLEAGREDKDVGDLRYLVSMEGFDRDEARAVIRKHLGRYAVKEFDAFIAETEWLQTRESQGLARR